ncbi:MAG: hypothetical protein ACJ72Z_09460 [Pyrinomonadaceae bacterium]
MRRIFLLVSIAAFVIFNMACGGAATTEPGCAAGGDTPTAAYKRLYEAVKSKNTETIKAQMTKNSVELANMISSQNKTPLDKVFENGFTGTTFSPALPDIRDERVDCNMGAIEVWNAKEQKWEDLPFIIEDGEWKLAIGELFKGSFKSPGKGLSIREAEAANSARGNVMPASNVNTNKIAEIPIPANSSNKPPKAP